MTPLTFDKASAYILTVGTVVGVAKYLITGDNWEYLMAISTAAWFAWRVVWLQEEKEDE